MNCEEARQAILEADLRSLEGGREDALSHHLSGCGGCRARAVAILEGERSLAGRLLDAVPEVDLDAVLARGMVLPGPGRAVTPGIRQGRWLRPAALVSAVAAAATTGLFLFREPSLPGLPYSPPPPSTGPAVEAPDGVGVAVLETGNPDITVLWLF